ncbi:MAG: efflux RND transporter periplasmic adaptor subunit [Methylophilaceae bacterium]
MRNIQLFALFFTSLLPCAAAIAAQPLGCLFEPERLAEVGSPVVGIIATVEVERGSKVRKGQVLATLRADVERASVNVADTRAKAEADVRTAEANLKLARITQKRGEDLVGKSFISQQALDKSIAETSIAEQKLILAREQLNVAGSELALARAQLGLRSIRSPIDGIVADRYVWPGERVEEKALFKIAKIDPIRIEMVLPVTFYGTITEGMVIDVTPDMPNAKPLHAWVKLVDKLVDGASNTFRMRAEIPNPDLAIPSGVRCKAELPDPPKPVVNKPADPFMPPPSGTLKLSPQPAAAPAPSKVVSGSPSKPTKTK